MRHGAGDRSERPWLIQAVHTMVEVDGQSFPLSNNGIYKSRQKTNPFLYHVYLYINPWPLVIGFRTVSLQLWDVRCHVFWSKNPMKCWDRDEPSHVSVRAGLRLSNDPGVPAHIMGWSRWSRKYIYIYIHTETLEVATKYTFYTKISISLPIFRATWKV